MEERSGECEENKWRREVGRCKSKKEDMGAKIVEEKEHEGTDQNKKK